MTTEEQQFAQYDLDEAHVACDILTGEIEMLGDVIAEHDHGCRARDDAELERAILQAALVYYDTKVAALSAQLGGAEPDAEVPGERPSGAPPGAMN